MSHFKQHYPMEILEIDSHELHVQASIDVMVAGEHEHLRTTRAHLLAAICPLTQCVHAWHLCSNAQPSQQDVLTLLENVSKTWEPMELTTPKLRYFPGACLPNALPEYPPYLTFNTIKSDNAKAHMAESVLDLGCRGRAATLEYGPPGQPEDRRDVEYYFNRVRASVEDFKSGTGTHSGDPRRESFENSKEPPLLRFNWLKEIIDVEITQYNATPMSCLMGETPLERFKRLISRSLLPKADYSESISSKPFSSTQLVNVLHDVGQRKNPHVYFSRLKYQGPKLTDPALKGKKIRVEFDRRDLRTIKARTLEGEDLGVLRAPKSWQRWPVSYFTVQQIRKLTDAKRLRMPDPLGGYFDYVAQRRNIPKFAMEIVRISNEFGLSPIPTEEIDDFDSNFNLNDIDDEQDEDFIWSPDLVTSRREDNETS